MLRPWADTTAIDSPKDNKSKRNIVPSGNQRTINVVNNILLKQTGIMIATLVARLAKCFPVIFQ